MDGKVAGGGAQELWEAIFQLRQDAGVLVKFVWTPSHMRDGGNDKANELAESGREMHPNNKKRRGDSEHLPQLWQGAGLSPMRTDVSSSKGSGDNSSGLSSRASVGGDLTSVDSSSADTSSSEGSCEALSSSNEDSGFSTDVSERHRERNTLEGEVTKRPERLKAH